MKIKSSEKKLRQISEHLEEILNLKIKSFESGSKRILKNSKTKLKSSTKKLNLKLRAL